jgi:S-adenosylmethionine hydrolase
VTRPIFFLTDFGLSDTFVGVVKAVILGIAPDAPIVDLTHDIPPQDVRAGAFALLAAAPYLPKQAIVLAVVDPGVGTARRPIAVEAGERIFVGPDNGLLSWALAATGGDPTPPPPPTPSTGPLHFVGSPCHCDGEGVTMSIVRPEISRRELTLGDGCIGVVLNQPRFWLPTVSASFHGRDLFGPVAAHLAAGAALTDVGSPIVSIAAIPFPAPVQQADGVHGEVIQVDRYGNLITSLTARDLPTNPIVRIAGRTIVGLAENFQAAAPLIAMIGSIGFLEVAVPNGSAASMLSVGVGAPVTVTAQR